MQPAIRMSLFQVMETESRYLLYEDWSGKAGTSDCRNKSDIGLHVSADSLGPSCLGVYSKDVKPNTYCKYYSYNETQQEIRNIQNLTKKIDVKLSQQTVL